MRSSVAATRFPGVRSVLSPARSSSLAAWNPTSAQLASSEARAAVAGGALALRIGLSVQGAGRLARLQAASPTGRAWLATGPE